MKYALCTLAVTLAALVSPSSAGAMDVAQAGATPRSGPEATDIAVPRSDEHFVASHQSFLKRAKEGPIGALFLGDSIVAGWAWAAPDVWRQAFGAYNPANFSVPGDMLQHLLWRVENGELEGIRPKVVVLLIGTNNIGVSAEGIVRGCTKIAAEIRARLPESKLLLLGLFPRGANPKDPGVAYVRNKIKTVNAGLARLADGASIRYLDIGDKFLDVNGAIPQNIMADELHPTHEGYRIWASAMQPVLAELMK